MNFDIQAHTIYKCRHGSHAYGLNTPESDLDIKGIAIAPIDHYLGFAKTFEQHEQYVSKGADQDLVIYDIQKFFKLAAECNPNIIEVLFCDENDILFINPLGREIRSHAEKFISKKAKFTFSGYAFSQLKRIKTHRHWLLNPLAEMPTRQSFGLADQMKMPASDIGAYDALISKGEAIPDNVMFILQKEKQYARAHQEWGQYQNWKTTRNKKRSEIEAKYGFDCKHATHLVRLLKMGTEILEGKGVIVKRPDREELLHIRNGGWTYDQLIEWAEHQQNHLDELYEKSSLVKSPDINFLDRICVDIISRFHKG